MMTAVLPPGAAFLGKYNVMQKGTYLVFALLMAVQALCGLALLEFWKIPFIGLTFSNILLNRCRTCDSSDWICHTTCSATN